MRSKAWITWECYDTLQFGLVTRFSSKGDFADIVRNVARQGGHEWEPTSFGPYLPDTWQTRMLRFRDVVVQRFLVEQPLFLALGDAEAFAMRCAPKGTPPLDMTPSVGSMFTEEQRLRAVAEYEAQRHVALWTAVLYRYFSLAACVRRFCEATCDWTWAYVRLNHLRQHGDQPDNGWRLATRSPDSDKESLRSYRQVRFFAKVLHRRWLDPAIPHVFGQDGGQHNRYHGPSAVLAAQDYGAVSSGNVPTLQPDCAGQLPHVYLSPAASVPTGFTFSPPVHPYRRGWDGPWYTAFMPCHGVGERAGDPFQEDDPAPCFGQDNPLRFCSLHPLLTESEMEFVCATAVAFTANASWKFGGRGLGKRSHALGSDLARSEYTHPANLWESCHDATDMLRVLLRVVRRRIREGVQERLDRWPYAHFEELKYAEQTVHWGKWVYDTEVKLPDVAVGPLDTSYGWHAVKDFGH
jgi:hypothetical protein